MRVAFVTSRYPPFTGGVETHVQRLAEGLVAAGHDVVVHTADRPALPGGTRDAGHDDDPPPARESRNGVRVRRHRSLAPGGAFHVAPGVAPAVRREDADLVHAHNYHSLPVLFAALGLATGTPEVPLVVTPHYHGGSASGVRDRLLAAYRPVGGWALARADAVIAVSDWERRRLAADFGVEATVIPNGLDVDRFAAAADAAGSEPVSRSRGRGRGEKSAGRDGPGGGESVPGPDGGGAVADRDDADRHGRPYLLTVGRLEAYKGVQHAIRALADLPEFDLVVAGSGPYRETLEATAEAVGVAGRVDFRGYVPDEDLPGLYAGAAAFLALSSFEAYGMTVAEALAAGTPCVVRERGALVDWVDRPDCVGVTDGPDGEPTPAAVRAAVEAAVDRPAPSDPLPTWESVLDRVVDVYGQLLGASIAEDGTTSTRSQPE
jgi:glycosyltransferase involved in cell wall biosynthesis